eukprot:TRINITY_DN5615_c0_g1_i1.p1 TRINITY_DN5615_c0_g1~~TRINITY_DN5615_c0_g1_i1.p1  ORF type:complete len:267 (+),score=90.75 TRINITY_DN5615_c0_g1_i1:170-970(+)
MILWLIGICLLLLAVATFFVETFYNPRKKLRAEQATVSRVRHLAADEKEQQRGQLLEKQQGLHQRKAFERQQRMEEIEREREDEYLKEKAKRVGYNIFEGHSLKEPAEQTQQQPQQVQSQNRRNKVDPRLLSDREIIAEQEREYQASLAEDRKKDEKKKEVEDAKVKEQKRLENAKANLPVEPDKSVTAGVISLLIRLPNGMKFERRFYEENLLQDVSDFVETRDDVKLKPFHFVTSVPRIVHDDKRKVLKELGLGTRAVLYVEEK